MGWQLSWHPTIKGDDKVTISLDTSRQLRLNLWVKIKRLEKAAVKVNKGEITQEQSF